MKLFVYSLGCWELLKKYGAFFNLLIVNKIKYSFAVNL